MKKKSKTKKKKATRPKTSVGWRLHCIEEDLRVIRLLLQFRYPNVLSNIYGMTTGLQAQLHLSNQLVQEKAKQMNNEGKVLRAYFMNGDFDRLIEVSNEHGEHAALVYSQGMGQATVEMLATAAQEVANKEGRKVVLREYRYHGDVQVIVPAREAN